MTTFITIIFVIVSLVMVLAILLQAGKGGGMGTALGGTASQGVFGGGGQADFMAKLTQGFAAAFMICAMYLAYASAHSGSELLEKADKGTKGIFEENEEIDPERIGPSPVLLPTPEKAKAMQAAASVTVPAQSEANSIDIDIPTPAEGSTANEQGADSTLENPAPIDAPAEREADPSNPNADTSGDAAAAEPSEPAPDPSPSGDAAPVEAEQP